MGLVSVQTLQGTRGITTAVIDTTAQSTADELGSLLPDPVGPGSFGGDIGAELAALAVKAGVAQEDGARTARDADEQTEVTEDNQEVADMHAKATDIRNAGIMDGAGMIAEGASEAGGAAWAMSTQNEPAGRERMAMGDSVGKILGGGGKIGSSLISASAANRDADAAAHRANADRDRAAADDMHDAEKSGAEFVSAALDFYKEYSATQAETNKAALHGA